MDPYRRMSQGTLRATLIAFFPAALLALLIIGGTNGPLRNPAAPLGIISFQLAATPLRAEQILGSWGEAERLLAAFNLGFDYLFLVIYPILLSMLCAYLARRYQETQRVTRERLGIGLAWAVPAAALLDAAENYALLQLLLGSTAGPWPGLAAAFAIPKWILVLGALGYGAFAATERAWTTAHALARRRKHR